MAVGRGLLHRKSYGRSRRRVILDVLFGSTVSCYARRFVGRQSQLPPLVQPPRCPTRHPRRLCRLPSCQNVVSLILSSLPSGRLAPASSLDYARGLGGLVRVQIGLSSLGRDSLRIPAIATTRSDPSRPPVPVDCDQCGAGCLRAPLGGLADLSVRCFRQAIVGVF